MKIKLSDITIERHAVDGFTLYGTNINGEYIHNRFIGYSLAEAKSKFLKDLRAGITAK